MNKLLDPCGDVERRTASRSVQFFHFLVMLLREDLNVVLVGLKPAECEENLRSSTSQRCRCWQHRYGNVLHRKRARANRMFLSIDVERRLECTKVQ